MTDLLGQLRTWFAPREATLPDLPAPSETAPPATGSKPGLHQLAAGLAHGAPCSPALLEALHALIHQRRVEAEVPDGPPSPKLTGLRVIRADLPPWWAEGENLLLAGEDVQLPELRRNPYLAPPRQAVVALGRASAFNHFNLALDGSLVVLGDETTAQAGALSCIGPSSILVGEGTTCTNWAMLDCRNGGIIVTGADGMWAHGANLMSDDTHAIRDAATGRRLNTFGGRIVIDRHVWLCEQVRVFDGARVGANAVIGAGSLVKRGVIPPNTVAVGIPARPVRSGVTWSREDTP